MFQIGNDDNYSVGLNDSLNAGQSIYHTHITPIDDSFNFNINENIDIIENKLNNMNSFGNINIIENTLNNINSFGNININLKPEELQVEKKASEGNSDKISIIDYDLSMSKSDKKQDADNIDSDSNISGDNSEPAKFTFQGGFNKLSIELNDEPTDFNMEVFCVKKEETKVNKSVHSIENVDNNPVILSPIVIYIFLF